jgi:arylsulfate sulfotransferase
MRIRDDGGWRNSALVNATMFMAAAIILGARSLSAVTIMGEPFFTPAVNAPLAGVLSVSTDVNSFVSISVNDGIGTWERDFFDYGTNHSETVLGFKSDRTNAVTVTVRDEFRNTYTVSNAVTFVSASLPATMPDFIVVTNNVAEMEPGYTLFRVQNNSGGAAYVTIVDSSGEVVWYGEASAVGGGIGPFDTPLDAKQLTNGNLFFMKTDTDGFDEINMLGQLVETWRAPLTVEAHEDLLTDHGTILYLNYSMEDVTNFPSSDTVSNAPTDTADVTYARVVEMSVTNSSLLNNWSVINMLDPVRVDYLCYAIAAFGIDCEHANAVVDSTSDDSIICSLRNQDAVIKFTRQGELTWILGTHENWGPEWQPYLLTPVGTPFEWNYAQHAPFLTPQGTLICFDDGNNRAEPFDPPVPDQDNYSRAVEFSIDETNMTVSQVWQFADTNADRLYCGLLGNARQLPQTGNVLITFGAISSENGAHPSPYSTTATMVRLKEVTHTANPTVVFDLEMFNPTNTNPTNGGFEVYRSYRIPDLYGHLAVPVPDLTVQFEDGSPLLQFTADPARTYTVQSSADLVNWSELGEPIPDDADGDFSFTDDSSEGLATRYYRVMTQ